MARQIPEDLKISIQLKEYDHLKTEIQNRLNIAFTHVAYAGAIVAFALPAASRMEHHEIWTFTMAALGSAGLFWVALLNMRWVQHAGLYLKRIERAIEDQCDAPLLGWETYAYGVQAHLWFFIPKAPNPEEFSIKYPARTTTRGAL